MMKKYIISLVLLIVVLIAISVFIFADLNNKVTRNDRTYSNQLLVDSHNRNNPNNKISISPLIDKNWEYVKSRLFDEETSTVYKLKGPILFTLFLAKKEDSLLVKDAIKGLRRLLPQKEIHFYEDFLGMSPLEFVNKKYSFKPQDSLKGFKVRDIMDSRIIVHFASPSLYKNPNHEYIQLGMGNSIQFPYPYRYRNNFRYNPLITVSMGDINTYKQKKEYLMMGLLRKLVFFQNNIEAKESSVFYRKDVSGLDCSILDRDVFLLQKLYAPDFLEQFKAYLYKAYPKSYANNFLNKEKAEVYAKWVLLFLGIFFFIIGFNLSYKKAFKYKYFNYFVPITILFVNVFHLFLVYYFLTDLTFDIINSDIYTIYFYLFLFAISTAFLLMIFDKYLIKKQITFATKFVFKLICTIVAFAIPFTIMFFINASSFGLKIHNLGAFILIVALVRSLLIYLNHFSENLIKQKDIELSQLKEVNAQAEVKLLQSQINPHFLYNALNSIASLAPVNTKKTQKMAYSLSNLFKYTINRKGKKMSTISDEIKMVAHYLEIEQIRFGERLKFTIDVEDHLKTEKIPLFIIQPLVENAVKHGISKIEGVGNINLTIKKVENGIKISVQDNGPDFPEGLVSGHGLQTVFDLLRLSYGDNASLNWQNTPEKKITILISQMNKKS